MSAAKRIAVVLATDDVPRARDALRGAIGLSLRGDAVTVVLAVDPPEHDPDVRRHLAALADFGHAVTRESPATAVRAADAVEVWT